MADLNNELDLNTPTAPTLTFETEAPTLTLDPAADEKVVEEAKKAACNTAPPARKSSAAFRKPRCPA